MTAMNVKTIHGQLPPKQFARVSKSYVINVSHMVSLDVDLIYLNNDIEIPLGNSYKQKFLHSHVNSKLFQR